jgi:acid phosphatase
MSRIATVTLSALLISSAYPLAAQQPAFSSDAAAERIPNLDKLKAEVEQYHDCTCTCGCYAHDIDRQADIAIAFLRRRAAHKQTGEKLALILDIDETTLSNYQEQLKEDFAFNKSVFDAWAQSAQAPAIGGTLRLYKEAQNLGVSVFLITGRPEDERAATERNLRAQGFDRWQGLAFRPVNHPASQTVIQFKSGERAKIVAQGYKLVLNVGDQWSDLRGAPEAEFSVKYPDPFYFIP